MHPNTKEFRQLHLSQTHLNPTSKTRKFALKSFIIAAAMCVTTTAEMAFAQPAPSTEQAPPAGITYKGVNLQLGGFLVSETVYRDNNMATDISTPYTKIPFPNSLGAGMPEFRGTERQSRFSLLAQGDFDSDTKLSGYYELDFLGTSPTANANESNSYTPRTRHVYMTADWQESGLHLLAGQNWSLATFNLKGITPRSEFVPTTIDAQYAVGFQWARQWQLRLTKDWDKVFWAALSFENSQTVGVTGASTGTINSFQLDGAGAMSNKLSFNSYPDVIAKFAYESQFGHYEIYGMARNFESRYGTGATAAAETNKQNVWTEAVGAGLNVPVYPKVVDLFVSGLFGKGIGRYGTAGLNDATYAQDGSLAPLTGAQYLAQLYWHTTPRWDVYAMYGQESVKAATGTGYGYGDGAVTSNSGCSTLGTTGATCTPNIKNISQANLGFWWSFYKGDAGTAKLGAQYSRTTLSTFADNSGNAPQTSENMIFTSLRYYPF